MLTIIDYGVGNLTSIKNMLRKGGFHDVIISNKDTDIATAEKLILPGVGHFDYGMEQLRQSAFFETLNKRVLVDKVPILGICLGAQLLTESSEEGESSGLGWIKGRTVRFKPEKMNTTLKVPHMGWGEIEQLKQSSLLQGLPDFPRFYFVHSYHLQCTNEVDELASCKYGYSFTACIERDNIVGVQFHPEKSHKFGLQLLSNFINKY